MKSTDIVETLIAGRKIARGRQRKFHFRTRYTIDRLLYSPLLESSNLRAKHHKVLLPVVVSSISLMIYDLADLDLVDVEL